MIFIQLNTSNIPYYNESTNNILQILHYKNIMNLRCRTSNSLYRVLTVLFCAIVVVF